MAKLKLTKLQLKEMIEKLVVEEVDVGSFYDVELQKHSIPTIDGSRYGVNIKNSTGTVFVLNKDIKKLGKQLLTFASYLPIAPENGNMGSLEEAAKQDIFQQLYGKDK